MAAALGLGLVSATRADYVVPANSVAALNGAVLDLACTDLVVGGTLLLNGAGINNVRNVNIQSGGVLDTTAGVVLLGGNWSNGGSFVNGGGAVLFRDVCSTTIASISGNNSFGDASFASSIGKTYVFQSGSNQIVSGLLQFLGSAGSRFSSAARPRDRQRMWTCAPPDPSRFSTLVWTTSTPAGSG